MIRLIEAAQAKPISLPSPYLEASPAEASRLLIEHLASYWRNAVHRLIVLPTFSGELSPLSDVPSAVFQLR
ncbi:hypothetical protein E8F20_18505 [Pseudomonas sp. BN415]|uniref:hypothetical protein n=1 Tax=Pseudomonas sp. BN415 TaxID=2567889 RepID=UPI002453FEEC|nr:hypothetical protein [Pseudomonas sp. BN415]MDH4583850.1 hypothetical protein [Pseudomonas sp. BN415]